MRDATLGGGGYQAGGDYGGAYSEEGRWTMSFIAGLALGFIVGVMTIIVIALALANKRGRRE